MKRYIVMFVELWVIFFVMGVMLGVTALWTLGFSMVIFSLFSTSLIYFIKKKFPNYFNKG